MAGLGDAPPFVRALPALVRRQLVKQCAGDWRRVTLDGDGAVTVHNKPQREHDQPPSARVPVAPSREPEPEPEPPPPPRWGQRTVREPIDTSAFTRIELPPSGPTRKRVQKAAAPRPATPDPVLAALLEPEDETQAAPIRTGASPSPSSSPVPGPALFASSGLPVDSDPVEVPVEVTFEVPVARKKRRNRHGAPRTTQEMFHRFLDRGCTYRRKPGDVAEVKFEGVLIARVATKHDTLEDMRRDYHFVLAALDELPRNQRRIG